MPPSHASPLAYSQLLTASATTDLLASVSVADDYDSHPMNEVSKTLRQPTLVRLGTRIGMFIGACIALLWTRDTLSFAHRPIETEELGLYQLFALVHCVVCLFMFPVLVAVGALVGRTSGIVVTRLRDRASRQGGTD